jgi:orotidine-5'-phosphate decarboxylase
MTSRRRAPRLAVALDVGSRAAAISAAETLRGHVDIAKVGLELFVSAGPGLVQELVDAGWSVFLDLKLHDIAATVAGAVRSAGGLGVEFMTIHAAGGRKMIEAAVAARGGGGMPLLLGVTVLTSLDGVQLEEIGVRGGTEQGVARLANLAQSAGCDGVVSSPHEVAAIKAAHGDDFLAVSPGIRPAGAAPNDQARVATVAEAVRAGADVLVVGRPIMKADDPAAVAAAMRQEMEDAHGRKS